MPNLTALKTICAAVNIKPVGMPLTATIAREPTAEAIGLFMETFNPSLVAKLLAVMEAAQTVATFYDQWTRLGEDSLNPGKRLVDALTALVALLRSDRIDPDMLDERARVLIGYVDPRDLTLLLPPR